MYDWRPAAPRPPHACLREHVQYFSRLGWALLAETAAMLIVQVVLTGALTLAAPGLLTRGSVLWLISVASVYGAGVPAACLLLRRIPAPPPTPGRLLGPGRFFQVYVAGLGVMYLVNFATLALTGLIGRLRGAPVPNPVESMSAFPLPLSLLLGCVIAPVTEELLFRRMLLERLRPYGEGFAIAASALCFGLFHGNLNQLFYACALGLLLGWTAVKTGRLWQPILLDGMFFLL